MVDKTSVTTVEQIIQSGLEAITSYETNDGIFLESSDDCFIESFNLTNIVDSKQQVSFIKKVETLVRSSPEYNDYIGYLRIQKNISKCSFFGNLNTDDEVSIEFHHTPFTLYDIVDIVTNHFLSLNRPVTTFIIADEVMKVHYQDLVGLVPLSISVHKLVHKGVIKISSKMVIGNWLQFMRSYSGGITTDEVQRLFSVLNITDEDVLESSKKIKVTRENLLFRSDIPEISLHEVKSLLLAGNNLNR